MEILSFDQEQVFDQIKVIYQRVLSSGWLRLDPWSKALHIRVLDGNFSNTFTPFQLIQIMLVIYRYLDFFGNCFIYKKL